MVQDSLTKLTLDRWREIMGIHPLHFWGVNLEPIRFTCYTAWHQQNWQTADGVSREEVAEAIASAEADLEAYLGFRLLPAWEVDERAATMRPWRKELFGVGGRDLRGLLQGVEARMGYFISGGVRATQVIETAAAIVYTNDGVTQPTDYLNVATVTVTVAAGLDPCEIAVFYPGHNADERWRIQPVGVQVSGTTATITFRREQAVVPSFFLNLGFVADDQAIRPADGRTDADFLTEVDVFRVFNDPQQQATLLWEPGPNCPSCNGVGCSQCGYATQTGCLIARAEPRLAILGFQPGEWNAATQSFDARAFAVGRNPDSLRLFYYAGWRDASLACPTVEMDADFARIVAYMASARLPRPPCSCAKASYERMAADLAFADGAQELATFNVSPSDLNNPFGTKRGEILAWKRVLRPGLARTPRGAFVS